MKIQDADEPRYSPVEMIKALVAFDTTSRDSNLELIRFVENYLNDLGVRSTLIFNAEKSKANLVATIGPATSRGGVVLSGHSDVVPVDGQVWSSDPFEVVERDERLYGRGTCDMKGFLAVALALVPEFQQCELRAPIHIVLKRITAPTWFRWMARSGAVIRLRLWSAMSDCTVAARAT